MATRLPQPDQRRMSLSSPQLPHRHASKSMHIGGRVCRYPRLASVSRAASRNACARAASRMLLIARLLTTTSNDAGANGRSRASASASSTWSRTPSATALRSAAARLLPLWSRRRRTSAPTARPPGTRRAASISTAPRPHPTSRTCSSPRRPRWSGSCARSRACPARWNTGSSPPTPRPRPVVRGNRRWRPPASPGHLSGCRDRRAGRRPARRRRGRTRARRRRRTDPGRRRRRGAMSPQNRPP